MIQPITQINNYKYKSYLSFKNNQQNVDNNLSILNSIDEHFKKQEAQNEKRNKILLGAAFSAACFATALLIPVTSNAIVNYDMALAKKKSPKLQKAILEFTSLANDLKIPTLENCKSLNKNLKDFLQHQLNYNRADSGLLKDVGAPEVTNRLLLYGSPGTGKSFFAKIYAKTLNAEYMEVKHSDFNSEWAGKGTDNLKRIFESIIKTAQENPQKKYVVTFNEIDTIVQPIEKMTEHTGGSYFMTKLEHRSAFLNYMDELSTKTPNVIVVGTTNLSPKNNALDGAAMSRFKNIKEVPLPDKDCLYEALKTNLKNIKNSDAFFQANESNLKELAKEMESKQYSFRNLENVVETSKNYYLEDKLKDKSKVFKFEYLQKAKDNISITDGELRTK